MQQPKVIRRELIYIGKFLQMVRTIYSDHEGRERIWESAERKNRDIVSIVLYDRDKDEFILIEQFRPPIAREPIRSALYSFSEAIKALQKKVPKLAQLSIFGPMLERFSSRIEQLSKEDESIPANDGMVIELVAGVCDVEGEAKIAAAIREAIEESGWKPQKVFIISLDESVSAGMQNELLSAILGTDLIYVGKKKGWEEDGIIVHSVSRKVIFEWLDEQRRQGKTIDAKVRGNIALAIRRIEEEGLHKE